jgi:hypothetical protein
VRSNSEASTFGYQMLKEEGGTFQNEKVSRSTQIMMSKPMTIKRSKVRVMFFLTKKFQGALEC